MSWMQKSVACSYAFSDWLPPCTKGTGGNPLGDALSVTDRVANHNLSYCVTVFTPVFTNTGQEDCPSLSGTITAHLTRRGSRLPCARHLNKEPTGHGSTFVGTGIPRECRTDGKPSLAAWPMNPFYRL